MDNYTSHLYALNSQIHKEKKELVNLEEQNENKKNIEIRSLRSVIKTLQFKIERAESQIKSIGLSKSKRIKNKEDRIRLLEDELECGLKNNPLAKDIVDSTNKRRSEEWLRNQ